MLATGALIPALSKPPHLILLALAAENFLLKFLPTPKYSFHWLSSSMRAKLAAAASIIPRVQLSSYLDRRPQLRDPKLVLEEITEAAEPDAYLRGLNPKHSQFEKLRQKYLALREDAGQGKQNVKLPLGGPRLKLGTSHPHVVLLRKRLGVPMQGG